MNASLALILQLPAPYLLTYSNFSYGAGLPDYAGVRLTSLKANTCRHLKVQYALTSRDPLLLLPHLEVSTWLIPWLTTAWLTTFFPLRAVMGGTLQTCEIRHISSEMFKACLGHYYRKWLPSPLWPEISLHKSPVIHSTQKSSVHLIVRLTGTTVCHTW